MFTLAALLICPDVQRLDSPDWITREAAEQRLRLLGFLAVPFLQSAAYGDSAEARIRAGRLLAPWRRLTANVNAGAVLLSPFPPGESFWCDWEARKRLHRIAAELCDPTEARGLLFDDWEQLWAWAFGLDCEGWIGRDESLAACRRRFGVELAWPFK